MTKRKLLIIGDVGVDTGFATVSHNLIYNLHTDWDISALAINYLGDPHPVQQFAKLYNPAAKIQGDFYGVNRVAELLQKVEPDVVLVVNDPWVASQYISLMETHPAAKVVYTPIDAKNIDPEYTQPLEKFTRIVTYTEFGKKELQAAGIERDIFVIPHGVDTTLYKPLNKTDARNRNGFDPSWYVVNVTDRNQIRKRIDLAFYAFSEWVKRTNKPNTVKLHYHGALLDEGWDIMRLSRSLGLSSNVLTPEDRLIITSENINSREGLPLHLMPYAYGIADVGLSTTMGEGWGLTTHERMAMRIPMIVPRYSALGEWTNNGVHYTDIADEPFFNIRGVNTRGGIPTVQSTIDALEILYTDVDYRKRLALAGYKVATDKQFQWKNVAQQFHNIFIDALTDDL
jgi:glycosyltransferase involved in cell wall biosynthesis